MAGQARDVAHSGGLGRSQSCLRGTGEAHLDQGGQSTNLVTYKNGFLFGSLHPPRGRAGQGWHTEVSAGMSGPRTCTRGLQGFEAPLSGPRALLPLPGPAPARSPRGCSQDAQQRAVQARVWSWSPAPGPLRLPKVLGLLGTPGISAAHA